MPGGLRRPPSMVRSVGEGSWTPPRVLAAAGVSAGGNPGRTAEGASAGRRGRRTLRFARGRAAAGACPSSGPAGPPSPRGKARVVIPPGVLAGGFAGRRGRRPLRFARKWAAAGGRPSSGPAGPPSPKGKARAVVGGSGRSRRGGGTPPYGWGYGNAVGFTWAPVSGPPHGRGRHARPGGLRGHPSMVRSVGRGLDPSAGGNPGKDVGASLRGASGTPPPAVCPGMGGSGSLPLIRPCGATFPRGGKARVVVGGGGSLPPTPAAGPRCGAGGSGCSTSGLTKPALYRRNPGRCRGGSRR